MSARELRRFTQEGECAMLQHIPTLTAFQDCLVLHPHGSFCLTARYASFSIRDSLILFEISLDGKHISIVQGELLEIT